MSTATRTIEPGTVSASSACAGRERPLFDISPTSGEQQDAAGVRVAPGRQTARSPSRGRPELHRRWMSSDAPRGRMLRADLAATGQTPGCGGISTRPTRTGSTPTIATVAKPPSVVPDPQAAYPTPLGRTASVEPTTRRCWTNSGRAPVRCPVRQGLAPSADGGGPATAAPHRPGPRRRSRSPAAGPR